MEQPTEASTRPDAPLLLERTLADALRTYAGTLGCPVGFLERPRVRRHHRRTSADRTIHTFARGDIELVSLPGDEDIAPSIAPEDIEELLALTRAEADPGAVVELRGAKVQILHEPAAIAVVDSHTLQRRPATPSALVYDPQPSVLDMLRSAVSPGEWREGGGETCGGQRVGALSGGVLVALATAEAPVGRLARLRVIVAPSHRRRGFGLTVLLALARRVLNDGFLPYCRLAVGDLSARTLAGAAGFVTFARSLTLRVVASSAGSEVHSDAQLSPRE
jgi:hypothetical protein